MKINGSLKFDASALSQIENLRVEKLSSLPTWTSNDVGRLVYITGTQIIWVGGASQWIAIATGGNASALQTEVDAIETSLGAGINNDGTFSSGGFSLGAAGTPTSFTDAINKLAAYASGASALTDLTDVSLASLANGDLFVYNSSTSQWNNKTVANSGVQPSSAILSGVNALAAGTGMVAKTGASSFSVRTITAPSAGITISNGDGVSGNPTLALANDLLAYENLGTTGVVVRTADGAATTRSVTGTAGRITVSNGDGVSGNPTIDLATVSQTNGGLLTKISIDTYGRISSSSAVVAADITALVDATYVNVTGDSMSGNLTFTGGAKVTGLPTPTNDTDAASKAYVDALQQGLSWKSAVRVATTGGISLSGPGSAIDGVALAVGNRVLVKNQSTASENGIYIFNGTAAAMTRASDMDSATEFDGSAVFVQEGTTNQNTGWTETATVTTVGTDPVTFVQFSGGAVYTFGTGLNLSGNTVTVNLGAGIGELPSGNVGIDLYNTASGALILTTDGSARSTGAASQLHLLLNGSGGLAQDASGLKINAASVTNAMLANSTHGLAADTGTSSVALGQTLTISGTAAQGISTSVSGQTVTLTIANATSSAKGVASFGTGLAVASGAVTLNASLDNLTNVSGTVAGASGSLLYKNGSTWQPIAASTFANSNIAIENLSNVADSAGTAGSILVTDGTTYTPKKIYFLYTTATAATTHTVTHNLNQKYCNVTVVDNTDNVIIPESIVFNTANQLTVTFNASIACSVVVMGV